MRWNASNHFTFNYQQHHHPKLTPKQPPPFPRLTTPLSLRRGAGGEALPAYHHLTFTYQQRRHSKLPPKQPPPFPRLTTPLPLRGGAGGEALFPSIYPPNKHLSVGRFTLEILWKICFLLQFLVILYCFCFYFRLHHAMNRHAMCNASSDIRTVEIV